MRVTEFKKIYPQLPLSPEPILTRWGTWIEAAVYHANYIEEVKNVINSFNPKDAVSI